MTKRRKTEVISINKRILIGVICFVIGARLMTSLVHYSSKNDDSTGANVALENNAKSASNEPEIITLPTEDNPAKFTITSFTSDKLMDNGEYPHEGYAASVDFPIGTKIFIIGVGEFEIVDYDTAPGTIEIFLQNEESCENFGVKNTGVYVIEE